MRYFSSMYLIPLEMTKAQAASASHAGQCDADVESLCNDPKIARQLRKIDPAALRQELTEYGAWDSAELADHAANLRRFVWIAAGDIIDGNY